MAKRRGSEGDIDQGPNLDWHIYSARASLPPVEAFCVHLIGRDWFGGKLTMGEGLPLLKLMLTVKGAYERGLLLTKKDARRVLEAEHAATMRRYLALADDLGLIELVGSELDKRAEYIVPTELGLQKLAEEIEGVELAVNWLRTKQDLEHWPKEAGYGKEWQETWAKSYKMEEQIDVSGMELTELSTLSDPLKMSPEAGRPDSLRRWVAAYSETLRILPDRTEVLAYRCEQLMHARAWEQALADALELEKHHPGEYVGRLSTIYLGLGRYDDAARAATASLKKFPDNSSLLLERARAYIGKERWKSALKDLDRFVEKHDDELEDYGRELRARVRAVVGDGDGALEDARIALERARKRAAVSEIKGPISLPDEISKDLLANVEDLETLVQQLAAHVGAGG